MAQAKFFTVTYTYLKDGSIVTGHHDKAITSRVDTLYAALKAGTILTLNVSLYVG